MYSDEEEDYGEYDDEDEEDWEYSDEDYTESNDDSVVEVPTVADRPRSRGNRSTWGPQTNPGTTSSTPPGLPPGVPPPPPGPPPNNNAIWRNLQNANASAPVVFNENDQLARIWHETIRQVHERYQSASSNHLSHSGSNEQGNTGNNNSSRPSRPSRPPNRPPNPVPTSSPNTSSSHESSIRAPAHLPSMPSIVDSDGNFISKITSSKSLQKLLTGRSKTTGHRSAFDGFFKNDGKERFKLNSLFVVARFQY